MKFDSNRGESALDATTAWLQGWIRVEGTASLLAAVLTLAATVTYSVTAGIPFGPDGVGAMVMSGVVAATLGAMVASLVSQAAGQLFSPRASVCVLIATAGIRWGATHAATPEAVGHAVGMLTACLFMAMLLQGSFAALRLGQLIRLVPRAVTDGLVIALAVKLVASQVRWMLSARTFAGLVTALAIAAVSIGAIVIAQRRGQKTMAALVGLGVGTAMGIALEHVFPSLEVANLQAVDPARGPLLSISQAVGAMMRAPMAKWFELATFSVVIALVNSMETLAAVLRMEQQRNERIDADNALLASALGSLASLCFGGIPVASTTTTSAVLARHGAASRRASLSTAVLVLVGALALGQSLRWVPLAGVAALMLMVGLELALGPARELAGRWRARRRGVRSEMTVVSVVVLLLLWGGPVPAIAGGLVAATLAAFRSMRTDLISRKYDAPGDARVRILELGRPLFFATVEVAVVAIEEAARNRSHVVLDLGTHGALDASAAKVLAGTAQRLAREGRHLLLVGGTAVGEFAEELKPCQVHCSLPQALGAHSA
jgi:MFS superfamily sulfate permease-like transporter